MTVTRPASAAMLDFAAARIAGSGVGATAEFPRELWREMAQAGLFRIGLPADHGGDGAGYAAIAAGERALAGRGGSLGLAMSWTGHQLTARWFVDSFADERQREALLPGLASGEITAAVAISEPGAGAHPKLLKTAATREGPSEREGGGWRLDGAKAYVTNGPIADVFVVLAVCEAIEGRKRYGAFLVPRDAAGLTVKPMPPFRGLLPSPHAELALDGVRVGDDAVLGPLGGAYEAMALPFRDVEDAMGLSGLSGTLDFAVRRLARIAPQGETGDAALGELGSLVAMLGEAADAAARALDDKPGAGRGDLVVGGRVLATHILERLRAHRVAFGGGYDTALDVALADVAFSLTIAAGPRAARLGRLGAALRG